MTLRGFTREKGRMHLHRVIVGDFAPTYECKDFSGLFGLLPRHEILQVDQIYARYYSHSSGSNSWLVP